MNDAVKGVSFEVGHGEVLGIVGESASGKSVTAMSIPDLLPTPPAEIIEGRILFDERDVRKMSSLERRQLRGREIGVVFQDPMTALNSVRRVGVQLMEGMRYHLDLDRTEAHRRAVDLLEQVGIPSPAERMKAYPHELSGGMRQRVMIASALACSPKLLIADEPTTALDVTVQAQIVDMVRSITADRDMSVIWITHDLSLLSDFADRTLVMYGGRVMEEAPTATLFRHAEHPYTAGLLASIVDTDTRRDQQLVSIPGTPPIHGAALDGCPFSPRCSYGVEKCPSVHPPLERVGDGHKVACWVRPFASKAPNGG